MARVNIDGPDRDIMLKKYAMPYTGKQNCTGATCAVSMTTIGASDIVMVTLESATTATYVASIAITAGTGFVVTPGGATLATVNYAVFAANA
jgi:hypothetical protein